MNIKGKKIIATVTNPLFHDQRMDRICCALIEQGAEVTLVGVKRRSSPKPQQRSYQQVLLQIPFQKGVLFYAFYHIQVFFYLIFHPFDLVISVDLDSLAAGFLAAGIKRKKRIYDAHEYFTEVPEVTNRPIVKWIWELVAKISIGQYNLTVSNSLKKVFEEKYGKRFEVIRNVAERYEEKEHKVKTIDPEKEVRLLYIGYLNEGRGLEYLIRALVHLPQNYSLTLAGSGDIETELKTLAGELKLTNKVHFTGWIDPADIVPFLKDAHIGFNLLESTSPSYYYSLANKTFSYMQFGIPAIHMDFPEYRSINEEFDCFVLCDSLEEQQVVNQILELANDTSHYKKLSAQNLMASNHFNWEKEQESFIKILKDFS